MDKTAICNGKIITDPSNELDDVPGIQWLVGGVLTGDSSVFFLRLVPNRKKETFLNLFKECVEEGTEIITDGHASYPWAIREFGSNHLVVNHSLGFVTEDGTHTNRIENFWSHFKQEYRARGGVNKNRMTLFIAEFSFRKMYIESTRRNSRNDALFTLLTIIDLND